MSGASIEVSDNPAQNPAYRPTYLPPLKYTQGINQAALRSFSKLNRKL